MRRPSSCERSLSDKIRPLCKTSRSSPSPVCSIHSIGTAVEERSTLRKMSEHPKKKGSREDSDTRSSQVDTARDPTMSEDCRTATAPNDREVTEYDMVTPEFTGRTSSDPASEAALRHKSS
ncbi:hypothetical protein L596_011314 [Steinernema carpocapsae]|uniref:Uncharacterized protein n=1 Tax=Steinernema carpocapsae TaxID=34508 RepID=A0A4U5NTY4_STECR|nr:hypothetical protein L596_011314 [Steinernema carpocapsae]